ncbi:MAG: Dihydroorotate dehydrogenase B (NAD(+)), catalytic subunit [Firmicutes bacterium ADurb.Bin193]|nr:MAG: Dihydroorotate dehydrogenase B (NAD(+)), catalytic subunit [Firmicutes bacterium ADurb.Bin193]
MTDLSVNIAGVKLKNPIITASGTFGNGREISEYYDLSQLGAVCVKAITLKPRQGNPPPRIAETPSGILNSVGLQNGGIDYFLKYELPNLKRYDTKVIANISGSTVEENCELARRLGRDVDLIELNISCPNVKQGGVSFGTDPKIAAEITARVKESCAVPLIVKLSPNVTDITEIAKAAENAGADALSLINTLLGMKIDVNTRRPVLANNTGGLSGPAVKPVAVRMVWQVFLCTRLPIIGMGGIMTGEDAAEFMIAGASAVAVGTANLVTPTAALNVKNELVGYLEKRGIKNVSELIGSVLAY